MKPLLFSLLSLCLLAGCKKDDLESCPTKCSPVPLTLVFSSEYPLEDIDTVVVKIYDYGEAFSQLDTVITYTLSDTVKKFDGSHYVGMGFDNLYIRVRRSYEVSIPATGQTFKLWDIKDPEAIRYFLCSAGGRHSCHSTINEFSIQGGEYLKVGSSTPATFLILKK